MVKDIEDKPEIIGDTNQEHTTQAALPIPTAPAIMTCNIANKSVSESLISKVASGVKTSISSNAATVISVTLLYPLEIVKTRGQI